MGEGIDSLDGLLLAALPLTTFCVRSFVASVRELIIDELR
jgi:hypothetical protein